MLFYTALTLEEGFGDRVREARIYPSETDYLLNVNKIIQ